MAITCKRITNHESEKSTVSAFVPRSDRCTRYSPYVYGRFALNFGQISHYDAARGGYLPRLRRSDRRLESRDGRRSLRHSARCTARTADATPGIPRGMEREAEISMRDIAYTFRRAATVTATGIEQRFCRTVRHPARSRHPRQDRPRDGRRETGPLGVVEPSVGRAVIPPSRWATIRHRPWKSNGANCRKYVTHGSRKQVGYTPDSRGRGRPLRWWQAEDLPYDRKGSSAGFDAIEPGNAEPVAMDYNASVKAIFSRTAISRRARPSTTLQLPVHGGIGDMVPPTLTARNRRQRTAC